MNVVHGYRAKIALRLPGRAYESVVLEPSDVLQLGEEPRRYSTFPDDGPVSFLEAIAEVFDAFGEYSAARSELAERVREHRMNKELAMLAATVAEPSFNMPLVDEAKPPGSVEHPRRSGMPSDYHPDPGHRSAQRREKKRQKRKEAKKARRRNRR